MKVEVPRGLRCAQSHLDEQITAILLQTTETDEMVEDSFLA